jgi:hypothetical protein
LKGLSKEKKTQTPLTDLQQAPLFKVFKGNQGPLFEVLLKGPSKEKKTPLTDLQQTFKSPF